MGGNRLRGRFVWYDLMTSDPRAAEAFYTKVIGWGTTVWDGPIPYTMWTVEGSPIGGVMPLPPGVSAPPHWMGYVAVPDVDTTVAQAKALDGKTLMPPTDIPAVGRFAVLADPHGALFAVFTPAENKPLPDRPVCAGTFAWHELMTTDREAAFRFYEALFGWHKHGEHDMGPAGMYLLFSRDGLELGGMFNTPASLRASPNWLPYIHVDNADRVLEVVRANGGAVIKGPLDVPGCGRIVQCLDPQGAPFAIHSRKA